MIKHEKKSWMHLFDAIVSGKKTHDIRQRDDDIKIGDFIKLKRFDHTTGKYTGEWATVEVTYMTDRDTPCAFSSSVLDEDYVILSVNLIDKCLKKEK